MVGYITIGTLGALVGVNLASRFFGLDVTSNPIMGNHISEAVGLIFLIGIIYDLLPRSIKFNSFLIAPLAALFGFIWEVFTFLGLSSSEMTFKVMVMWLYYGVPTAFLIGLPALFISNFMRMQKKILGIDSVSWKGLAITFVINLVVSFTIFGFLITNGIYESWVSFFE